MVLYALVIVGALAGADNVTVVDPPIVVAAGENRSPMPCGEFAVKLSCPDRPLRELVAMVKLADAPPWIRVIGDGWVSAKSSR